MNAIMAQFKREMAEHKGAVVYGPIIIASLMALVLVTAIVAFEVKGKQAVLAWNSADDDFELILNGDKVKAPNAPEAPHPSREIHLNSKGGTTITEVETEQNGQKIKKIEIKQADGTRKIIIIPEDKADRVNELQLDNLKVIIEKEAYEKKKAALDDARHAAKMAKEIADTEMERHQAEVDRIEAHIEHQVARELERSLENANTELERAEIKAQALIAKAEAEAVRAERREFREVRNERKVVEKERRGAREILTEDDIGVIENASLLIIAIFAGYSFFVGAVYALGTLYNDRKDRSILFWKSMPLSEERSIAVKLAFALLVVPFAALLAAFVIQGIYLVAAGYYISSFTNIGFFQVLGASNYFGNIATAVGYVLMMAPWSAAMICWLFVASSFAKRSPFLLAIVPFLIIAGIEDMLIGTNFVRDFVLNHIPVWHFRGDFGEDAVMDIQHSFGDYFSLDFVIGLIITAAFFYAAVWARKHRFEI